MPNAVLVALASASLTAASGAALTHIRSHRNPSAARLHGTSPLGKKRTHRHHGHRHGRTRASASPEIEALRVKPGWHPEGSPETRVKQLGYDLEGRCATNPAGVFYPVVLVGDLAYVSGQVPRNTDGSLIVGKCGDDMSDEDAVEAAKVVGLTMLATMRQQFGSLDHIERIVKVNGFVNCTLDYRKQPAVVNGLANLFIEVFGPAGKSSRSAVGSSGLPLGVPVECEAIVELKA
jgi:enamine deaminase RidA (YjgF/YER057c/UK114 family)